VALRSRSPCGGPPAAAWGNCSIAVRQRSRNAALLDHTSTVSHDETKRPAMRKSRSSTGVCGYAQGERSALGLLVGRWHALIVGCMLRTVLPPRNDGITRPSLSARELHNARHGARSKLTPFEGHSAPPIGRVASDLKLERRRTRRRFALLLVLPIPPGLQWRMHLPPAGGAPLRSAQPRAQAADSSLARS
jgi:hypothetical protein